MRPSSDREGSVQGDPRSIRRYLPLALSGAPFPVSGRQAEILELAARGLSDKEIANHLGVTHWTVRSHLERLYNSSGVRGRTAVVVAWVLSSERVRRELASFERGDAADPTRDADPGRRASDPG
jgi:DNA-binding CsgD family transcriptional regulator